MVHLHIDVGEQTLKAEAPAEGFLALAAALDVQPRAEGPSGAAHHHDPAVAVALQAAKVVRQFGGHLGGDRIEGLGSIQCEPVNRSADVDRHGLIRVLHEDLLASAYRLPPM